MAILDSAQKRYSTKAFDPKRKVSKQNIQALQNIVRLSPSSINIQPWHILITNTDSGKQLITQATQGNFIFNNQKILDASHIMVFCARNDINQDYANKLLAKEKADGRMLNDDILKMTKDIRNNFLSKQSQSPEELKIWIEKQLYIALGNVLLAAADMGIDSVPIEGFNPVALDNALGLKNKKYYSVVMAAFGYRSIEDFNADLPKSRFELSDIFTEF